jgi:hypothetical protein
MRFSGPIALAEIWPFCEQGIYCVKFAFCSQIRLQNTPDEKLPILYTNDLPESEPGRVGGRGCAFACRDKHLPADG